MKTTFPWPGLQTSLICFLISFVLQARGQVVVTDTTIEITVAEAGDFAKTYADATTWQSLCPSNVVRLKVNGPINNNDLQIIKDKVTETLVELDMAGATWSETGGVGWYEFGLYDPEWDNGYKQYLLIQYLALPAGLKSLGPCTFYGSANLRQIIFQEGLEMIEEYAFTDCSSLTSITLPSTINDFCPYFENTGLTEIHLKCTDPPYAYSAEGYGTNITLYVPVGCLSVYQNCEFGKGWKEIKEEMATLDGLADADWAVLQQLYADTQGASWTRSWELGATAAETNPLEGVIVNNGHLVQLDLHDNNLQGPLPASLFRLQGLTTINLAGNQLTGNLTTLFAEMPENSVITTLDLGSNQLTGNTANLTQALTGLTTLKADRNRIRDCYPLPPTTIKTVSLEAQDLTEYMLDGEGHPIALSTLCAMSLEPDDQLPSVLRFYEPYLNYGAGYTLPTEIKMELCDDFESQTWNILFCFKQFGNLQFSFDSSSSTADGWYRGELNAVIDAFVGNRGGSLNSDRSGFHRFKVTLDSPSGDVDFDGKTGLSDMQRILNVALDKNYYGPSAPFNLAAANLIATDDSINVQDLVACVSLLLSQGLTPSLVRAAQPRKMQQGDDDEATLTIDGQGRMLLNTAVPVAAIELQLTDGDTEWSEVMSPFSHASREEHHIFYSMFDDQLPAGITLLATTTARLVAAEAVSKDGRRIPINFSQGVTDEINDTSARAFYTSTKYYDLQGLQIEKNQLKPGIYIRDGKKMFVK